ncbi:MAG: hypothetical protein JNL52_08410 [Flavobacteriales bacterium]|nr:hypothetical protein [Flavobacteriales bacterium]
MDEMKEIMSDCGLTEADLVDFAIATANRELIIITDQKARLSDDVTEQRFEDLLRHKVESIDPSIGQVESQAAVETTIDAIQVLLNTLRHVSDELPSSRVVENQGKAIGAVIGLKVRAMLYYVVKSEYDYCIWNEGYAVTSTNPDAVMMKCLAPENLLLSRVGFLRLQKTLFAFYMGGRSILDNHDEYGSLVREALKRKRTATRLEKVSVQEGAIKYELGKDIDNDEIAFEIKSSGEMAAYYSYIHDVALPALNGLTLKDILLLFTTLQFLVKKAADLSIEDDSVVKLTDFNKFPYRMLKRELIEYLLQRTTFNERQVDDFLKLVTNKQGNRISFWDYPLLPRADYFVFPLLSLVHPMTLVLIDRWLEDGGFDLDERGRYFEKHIKKTIALGLRRKGYQFVLPETSKFKLPNGQAEEIDLILNLKHTCIIAEVKCIKYSMGARDTHNALARLRKASEQVRRKANFILQHKEHFQSEVGIIEGKELVKLVITNYPIYSGYRFNEIPVVDFFLLDAYINAGGIDHQRVQMTKDGLIKQETVYRTVFYEDEDGFCRSLMSHMAKPPAIDQLREHFEHRLCKLTPEGASWAFYADTVEYVSGSRR